MQTRGAAVTRWGRQHTNMQDAGKHAPPERRTGSQHPLDRQRQARVLHHRCARCEICEKVAAERKRGNGKHLLVRQRYRQNEGRTTPNRFTDIKGVVVPQDILRTEVMQQGVLLEPRDAVEAVSSAGGTGFTDLRQTSHRARRDNQVRQRDSRCIQVFLRPRGC